MLNIWNNEHLPSQWNEGSFVPFIKNVIGWTVVITDQSHC
jgi:hypothetical protein